MTTTTEAIADASALPGFDETFTQDCRCRHCSSVPARRAESGGRPGGRIHRAVRSTCLATTVLAGAGVLGLGLGAGTAEAMPAPAKPGWDGSVYWFKNAAGEWRYTKYLSTYRARTGSAGPSGAVSSSGGGIRQGWDGSVYWFRNAAGEWRYTKYLSTYQARTGSTGSTGSTGQAQPQSPSRAGYEAAISYALAQVGKPYLWGGNGPNGFDCSGLVQQAYRRAGVETPRVADDQYRAATPISASRLRRGDLVFWSGNGRVSGIHHVAIYLGDGTYVEAPRPGKNVRVSRLTSGYYPDFFGRP
ncbi:C40 family peptidase [Kitasatospora sp. NPDC048365]|uniref:C40 family peptidase n=1 Tax=Kitasatospora sp. NPDC048365 TaxID=3364050 RepID=UPI0037127B39